MSQTRIRRRGTAGDRLDHWVSAQLGGRPDPMHSVLDAGLPAVARLNDVIAGLTRPRNDVPTPIEPGPSPLVGPVPGRVLRMLRQLVLASRSPAAQVPTSPVREWLP